ncbi:MAG: type II secretion system major pseudopilin GspG [Steroidobacteraceae bacterium]|jgi:general secretion pathway protein G|nr:type II secretion system major pseudopilin GspG [Steroidobacteraceae bacterium]
MLLAASGAARPPRAARGFTLIEIMVVVVILAILGTLVAPQILGRIDEARVTKAKNDLRLYESALDMYRMDNFRYPTTDQGLQALVRRPSDPNVRNWRPEGYVKQLVQDPWDRDYVYVAPGTNGAPYDLYTLGADGQPGGEGTDADIHVREMTQ